VLSDAATRSISVACCRKSTIPFDYSLTTPASGAFMKFLVFVKATPNTEKGIFPPDTEKLFADMGKFNEQLVKAGIMQDADGLKPSREGKRIQFSDESPALVIDGPFAETKELVAGYWIWNVKSMAEAVKWAKRCPNPMPGEKGVLEIRPCYTLEDLSELVPEAEFKREVRLRKQVAGQQKAKSARAKSAKKKRGRSS
jgi:hypothetical protein